MRISTLATQMYPKSRFKSRRCLGLTRDSTSCLSPRWLECPKCGVDLDLVCKTKKCKRYINGTRFNTALFFPFSSCASQAARTIGALCRLRWRSCCSTNATTLTASWPSTARHGHANRDLAAIGWVPGFQAVVSFVWEAQTKDDGRSGNQSSALSTL